eukprot:3805062-Prymnesium_polylepis.1
MPTCSCQGCAFPGAKPHGVPAGSPQCCADVRSEPPGQIRGSTKEANTTDPGQHAPSPSCAFPCAEPDGVPAGKPCLATELQRTAGPQREARTRPVRRWGSGVEQLSGVLDSKTPAGHEWTGAAQDGALLGRASLSSHGAGRLAAARRACGRADGPPGRRHCHRLAHRQAQAGTTRCCVCGTRRRRPR